MQVVSLSCFLKDPVCMGEVTSLYWKVQYDRGSVYSGGDKPCLSAVKSAGSRARPQSKRHFPAKEVKRSPGNARNTLPLKDAKAPVLRWQGHIHCRTYRERSLFCLHSWPQGYHKRNGVRCRNWLGHAADRGRLIFLS